MMADWWRHIDWDWVRETRMTCIYDGPDFLLLFWLT